MRRWMVDDNWLAEEKNQKYDGDESRIVISGVAWGDDQDPADIVAKKHAIKEHKRKVKEQKTKPTASSSKQQVEDDQDPSDSSDHDDHQEASQDSLGLGLS